MKPEAWPIFKYRTHVPGISKKPACLPLPQDKNSSQLLTDSNPCRERTGERIFHSLCSPAIATLLAKKIGKIGNCGTFMVNICGTLNSFIDPFRIA
jgi:hypothetical protein